MVHKVIRKIIMKKKIGLISLLMAGTTAVALTGCSNNSDAQVKQIEEDVASVQKQVKTLQENLNTAKSSLEESVGKISTYLEIEKIATNGDVVSSIKKQIADLEKATDDALDSLETAYTAAINAKAAELTQTIETKETALKAQIKDVTDAIAALGDTYATDEELQAAVADVNAKLGELAKDNEDKVIPVQTQINNINNEVDSLGEALVEVNTALTNLGAADEALQGKITAAENALAEYKTSVAETYATIAQLESKETTLKGLIDAKADKTALDKAVEDLNTALGEDAAALTAYKATVESTYATKAALQSVEETLTTTYVTKAIYEEAIDKLNAAIGEVETDDDGVISLQKQITALENAKATVEALDGLAAEFVETNKEFAVLIAGLQDQIGDVKKDEDGKVILSIQAQIDDLTAKIGKVVAKDDEGKLITLQEQIDEIKAQIGDFSGSAELTKIKAAYNKKLSNLYADFQDKIEDCKDQLYNKYGQADNEKIKQLFKDISRSFNHEMTGYLYEGMTYITLAKTADEAEDYEAEYELLIGNYINPALFEISKQVNLAIINDATLTYIGDVVDPADIDANSIRGKYYKQVADTSWFTEEQIKNFTPEEYKAATEDLDDAMTLSANKAQAINALLTAYNTAKNTIASYFTTPVAPATYPEIYTDFEASADYDTLLATAITKFDALLDTIKGDLTKYDNCTNAMIQNLDPFTGDKGEAEDITDLADQLENDTALINFVVSEATKYVAINSYTDTTYKTIRNTYTNLNILDDTELATIKNKLLAVVNVDDYAALTITVDETTRQRTEKDLKAQYDSDTVGLDLIKAQAQGYNASVGEARSAVAYITDDTSTPATLLSNLYGLKINDTTDAIDDLIDKIYAVPKLATYLVTPKAVEETDTETKTIDNVVADDQLAIGTLVDQGKDFNSTLTYVKEKVDTLTDGTKYLAIKAKDTANETTELKDIINKISAVPVYTNYVANAQYKTNVAQDLATINLIVNEATAYNKVLKLVEDKIAAVKELVYIGKPADPADGTSEEEKIIVEFNKIATYANYINEELVTIGEGDEAEQVYKYTQSYDADIAAINLLFDQVDTYNDVKKLAAESVATVNALTNITDTEKTNIVGLINGVADYANYVGNNTIVGEGDEAKYSYLLVEETDTAEIKLIVAQAQAYDEVRGYATARNIDGEGKIDFYVGTEHNIVNAKFIKEDEQTAINALINGVPVYPNYINDKLTTDKIAEKVAADKLAVDNYVVAVQGYNVVLNYINADTNGKVAVVDGILENTQQEASEKSTITTAMTGIPVYNNYFGTVKVDETTTRQLTAEEIKAQVLKDGAAVDLLVTRAQVFKAIYDAVNAPNATDGLVAYIDGLSSGYTADLSKGQFTTELKNKFKAQFTDLAVAAKFDEVVKGFTTEAEFTAYKNSIIGAAATDTTPAIVGKLPLIKKSATIFCNILNYVNTNEDYINDTITFSQFTGDYEIYAQAFINNFIALQDYDAYMTAIKDFKTEDAFDTYYGTNIKTFIDNVVKVAKYENKLLDNVNFVKEAISNAQDPQAVPTIKTNAATYLTNVVKSIYAEFTSVTKADDKYTTKTTIADNANAEPKAQLDAVDAAIQKLYEADIAAANLSTNLTNYIEEQRTSFFTNYYMYRDDAIYRGTNELNQFGGYNQAALEAWNFYIGEIQEYRLEKEYKYTIPTESTYTAFTSFIEKVAVPTSIASRFDAFKLWYSEDTEQNPKGGKVYEIIAKYEQLDAAKVSAAKEYFLGKFKDLYDGYYATISDANSKTTLTASYDQYRSMIGSDYGSTTTTIIMFYLNGVTALDNTYNSAVTIYRSAKLSALESKYNTEKTDISEYTIDAYTLAYTDGVNAIKADTVITEAQVDTAYNAAVAAMNAQKELDTYKTTKRTALETAYTTNKTNYPSSEAAFTTAKTTGVDAINAATSTTAVDTAYNTAISAMNTTIGECKTSYKNTLGSAYEAYGQNPADNITTAYNNGLTAIDAAATESAVETACNNAIAAMEAANLANYKATKIADLATLYNDLCADITTDEKTALDSAYATAQTNINACTSVADVNATYPYQTIAMNACVQSLDDYKLAKISALEDEESALSHTTGLAIDEIFNISAACNDGKNAINATATDTKAKVDTAYNAAVAAMEACIMTFGNYKEAKLKALHDYVDAAIEAHPTKANEIQSAYGAKLPALESLNEDQNTKTDVYDAYNNAVAAIDAAASEAIGS